ncbi:hypothetical protein AXG93_3671s1050 [Marchantia polymorpha subsp. ruderalis]|uniref:Uncharacterized protein n=1 Tax=Marchantia polymorpha subsp. ruderalis TaxID=1480154 RepID=A0A176WJL7_MARPO|nr:hypothetical protein AXG93_3671s1050 [Marchantia polymorpha subsp. ruderalis]
MCRVGRRTCGGLCFSNENAHKVTVDLMARLEKSREAYDAAVKRSERLIITAKRREKMHVKELAKLGKAQMRSQEAQRRMEKAEEAYCQLRKQSTDELKLRLEKCLNGFAMWGLQWVKWLKLDLLEQRLMSAKTNGSARHKQIIELVNTFSEGLNDARQNVEVEIVNMLRLLGVDSSSDDAVTVTSDGTTPKTNSPQAVEIQELPL